MGMHINKQKQIKKYEPIVVMKKNNTKALVVIDAEYFVNLHNE